MDGTQQLGLFFGIVLGVVLLPGIDMTFVLATALTGGRRGGFAGVLGIVAAGFVHVAVGVAGIAAVLLLVPALYNALLLGGAIYLGWIACSLLRSGSSFTGAAGIGGTGEATVDLGVAFRRGMLTNLLNPKAYAFMLAVFPQFVDADRGSVWLQAVPLALVIASTQLAVYGAVVFAAAGAGQWLACRPHALATLGRLVGALLLVAAVASAWQGWKGIEPRRDGSGAVSRRDGPGPAIGAADARARP